MPNNIRFGSSYSRKPENRNLGIRKKLTFYRIATSSNFYGQCSI